MNSQIVIWNEFESLESFDAIILNQTVFQNFNSLFLSYIDKILLLETTEEVKSIHGLTTIVDFFIKKNLQPGARVLAIGGGALCDLAGFVCAIYKRGVDLVIMPTTLVCMVDAAIGGKNAINYQGIKNLLGTFKFPSKIIYYLDFLKTLSIKQKLGGMGEVLKTAIIGSKELFDSIVSLNLDPGLIFKVAQIKIKIVDEDPFDKGIRHVLNFGHTVGHAYESALDFHVEHGEAVALGILVESLYSHLLNRLPIHDYLEIKQKLENFGYQFKNQPFEKLYPFILADKKNKNHTPKIHVLEKIGLFPKLENLDFIILKQAYESLWM
jgi:3-dehydroquinate synthase